MTTLDDYRAMITKSIELNPGNWTIQNMPLVIDLAKKFLESSNNDHVDVEELISYGNFGLVKAIAAFKPDKGISFSTFAGRIIYHEFIRYAIDRTNHGCHVPRKTFEAVDTVRDFVISFNRLPTPEELWESLGTSVAVKGRYHEIISAYEATNLFAPLNEILVESREEDDE